MNTDLGEFLATEVMGWGKIPIGEFAYWEVATPEKPAMPIDCSKWKPSENIEQAIMCLGQFKYWDIFTTDIGEPGGDLLLGYACTINDGVLHLGEADALSLPLAISLACARARGYTDE